MRKQTWYYMVFLVAVILLVGVFGSKVIWTVSDVVKINPFFISAGCVMGLGLLYTTIERKVLQKRG